MTSPPLTTRWRCCVITWICSCRPRSAIATLPLTNERSDLKLGKAEVLRSKFQGGLMHRIVRMTLFLAAPVFCQTFDAPSFVNEATINAPLAAVWNVWTSGDAYKSL